MSLPTVEVADILRAQGDRFLDRYRRSFDFQQLKAFRAIQRCRTAALGGHIDACPKCGHQAISYNSCLMGVISNGEWSGKRACCTRRHTPSTLH